ncbi:Nitrite/Sulfite reductase ferredoxin-like half domain-containing protein [Methanosarcina thermophila]|jgi:NAD(P)H-nitrite reductase large subunit|uniref:Nitrite/Sulfite reductase ferredoxin-like half domain-containing protein n=3 Tax=Methanosarcina thermophila TaxID=2210 RepID=A0A1I6XWH7_METTE|nr:NAD(P)/FAD-dependent oxidoreductase [Methanosarcina thermophila]ALK05757.1 MAG: sulfite reductase [Methanosarcina sp. 795]AKB12778.1 Dissimilatory sulfite reductase (desulfoviridin), alpha and beta subunits [Methanosarcina thermophila TM-1]AKB16604.1 Dissimilatory sulfite reductase (desulfoviridin), alpha and beta subunits [Methanosarcina thermophila CHTI-55]SFT42789.1 Nitrite/Sulfite reductase ferredoxin-like half domain-containing protein [Methanosarcina thermophila]BAW30517.1 sulfite red
MKDNLPEKGAIVQRDRETYAIAPHLPGGIVEPETLMKIAKVAEKYGAAALKVTSAQRIAIVGLKEEDLDNVWAELDMKPGAAIGLCVRSVKFCPGTTFCKQAKQDSVSLGLKLDEKYHGMPMPSKMKMAVSGCPNSCAEPAIKDIGVMGTAKGYTLMVGGSAAATPRLAEVVAKELSEEEVLETIDRIINFYKSSGTKKRLGRFIEDIGLENFKTQVGL